MHKLRAGRIELDKPLVCSGRCQPCWPAKCTNKFIYRSHGLDELGKLKFAQREVSKLVNANTNASLFAIEQYQRLVLKHAEMEQGLNLTVAALNHSLVQSKETAESIFEIIKDRLKFIIDLQLMLTGQFVDFWAILFYLFTLISAFIITAFESTACARLPLVLFNLGNFVAEYILRKNCASLGSWVATIYCGSICDATQTLKLVGYQRLGFMLLSALLFVRKVIAHKDPATECLKSQRKLLLYVSRFFTVMESSNAPAAK